jgi:hypothetical protein
VYVQASNDNSRRVTVFSTASASLWRYEDIESDAEVLGADIADGVITRLFAAGAMTIRIGGSAVTLTNSANGLWEWAAGPGQTAPFSCGTP